VPRARAGGLPLSGIGEVLCVDHRIFRVASGSDFYGTLGMDFLRDRVVRLDFDRGEVGFLNRVPEDSGAPVVLDMARYSRWPPTVVLGVAGIGDHAFIVDTGDTSNGAIEARLLARLLANGDAVHVDTGTAEYLGRSRIERTLRLRGEVALGGFRHKGLTFSEAAGLSIALSRNV